MYCAMAAMIASITITTVPAIIPCVPGCSCVLVEEGGGGFMSPGDTVIVAVGVIGIDDMVGLYDGLGGRIAREGVAVVFQGVRDGVDVLDSDELVLLEIVASSIEDNAVISIGINPPLSDLMDVHGLVPHG
jgi:hypothetical protein